MANYWTTETDAKVFEYKKETDPVKREQIYNEHLHKPLRHLAEAIYFRYKKFEDLDVIQDLHTHLISTIDKCQEELGRPFSFISTCGVHYVLRQNMMKVPLQQNTVSLDMLISEDDGISLIDVITLVKEDKFEKTTPEKVCEYFTHERIIKLVLEDASVINEGKALQEMARDIRIMMQSIINLRCGKLIDRTQIKKWEKYAKFINYQMLQVQ